MTCPRSGPRSTVPQWLQWYREGGLAAVCRRRKGRVGALLPDPGAEDGGGVAVAATGPWATAPVVRDWIEARCGVVYTVGSLYT